MRLKKLPLLFVAAVIFFGNGFPVYGQSEEYTLEGKIIDIYQKEPLLAGGETLYPKVLKIYIEKGIIEGRMAEVEHGNYSQSSSVGYSRGDRVVVSYTRSENGEEYFSVVDKVRRKELVVLLLAFVFISVVIGGVYGLTSLIGMAYSFFVIFYLVLPKIVEGNDPVLTSLLGAALIIPVNFYLSHGFKEKTHIAVFSTLISLAITGILAFVAVKAVGLSGYSSDESSFVANILGKQFDMKGLLLSGIIISLLGILDDVTVSQASIVFELKKANGRLKRWELFRRGMSVGRDHIASLINTLVLVYAGSSLPLLLLFTKNPIPFETVINFEIIAEEIVKTIVGSCGLILAVPISTFIASFIYSKNPG